MKKKIFPYLFYELYCTMKSQTKTVQKREEKEEQEEEEKKIIGIQY